MTEKNVDILLFLAQGFEDLEAVAVLDVFSWTRYRKNIPTASVVTAGFHDSVRSHCGLSVKPDLQFSQIDSKNFQALVLPGGFHGQGFEEAYDERLFGLARHIHRNGGHIATMCVGSVPIALSGILTGKTATTYPYSRHHDNIGTLQAHGVRVSDARLIIDDRIISCSGPGASLEVAFLLMECLLGGEAVRQVKHYMIVR